MTGERKVFSREERDAIRAAITEWLRIRERFEAEFRFKLWQGQRCISLAQLRADVDHSALLERLLAGRAPLDEPPPTHMSYPVYPDVEEYRT